MLYVKKVLFVIKSGGKNKPMDQDENGGGSRDEKPAKINRGDDSPTRLLGVEMCDVIVTSYVTTCLSFFINYMPHHLFCLDKCDVITYVIPRVV